MKGNSSSVNISSVVTTETREILFKSLKTNNCDKRTCCRCSTQGNYYRCARRQETSRATARESRRIFLGWKHLRGQSEKTDARPKRSICECGAQKGRFSSLFGFGG